MGCGCRLPQCRTLSSCTVHSSCSSRRWYRTPRPHSIWRTRDSWSAIAPTLPASLLVEHDRPERMAEMVQTGSRRSVRLDARELHHLPPLLGFVGDELTEFSGRACKRQCT